MADLTKLELVNPEGIALIETKKVNPHPQDLTGKTVVLHWNGKHNGNIFLSRVGELLEAKVKDIKVIKGWEVEPEIGRVSQGMDVSKRTAGKIAAFKPHLVIGAQGD
jgi:hypothetical protein